MAEPTNKEAIEAAKAKYAAEHPTKPATLDDVVAELVQVKDKLTLLAWCLIPIFVIGMFIFIVLLRH